MNLPDILEKIEALTDNQRTALVKDTVEKLGETAKKEVAVESVRSLSPNEKTEVVRTAAEGLSEADRQKLADSALGQPTQQATDTIWLIIVWVFAIGLALSIFAIIYLAIFGAKIDDKLIIIFTTTSAFLAGLIVPSPMSKRT